MFMLLFLKYGEDMNSQVFAELPTSTVVSDTSLVEETLLVELHLGGNTSFHEPSSSLNKAFEWWPVRSLINFSSTPALNNVDAHVIQRLWLLFGLKPAYQTLPLPLFARLFLYWVDLSTAFWTRLTSSSAVFACRKRDDTISHEEWPNWDQGMYMCSTLNNDGPQGLVTLLEYLTTKANNYWKQ